MLRIIAILLVSGGLIASSAFAQSAGFIGNTIVSETTSFGTLSFAVAEDGTFTRSDGISDTWALEGDQLCFFAEGQDDLCGYFDAAKQAGDSWEDAAWDGNGIAKLSIHGRAKQLEGLLRPKGGSYGRRPALPSCADLCLPL